MATNEGDIIRFVGGNNLPQQETEEAEAAASGAKLPFIPQSALTPGVIDPEPVMGAGARFVRGVGAGVVSPVRALLPDSEPLLTDPEDPTAGIEPGIAGALGQLVGAGLTFIPIGKAASMTLGGVGLLKTGAALGARVTYLAPFGQTGLGVRAAHLATWGTAGAMFEAFNAEEIEGAGERALTGFALGAAFEIPSIEIARAWRRSRGAWRAGKAATSGVDLDVPTTPPNVAVHPLALKLENMMRPLDSDDPELVMGKLRELGTPQEQLTQSFMNLMTTHMPGGQALLSGLTRKEVKQLTSVTEEIGTIDTRGPGRRRIFNRTIKTGVFRRIKGEDSFDVLLVDTSRSLWAPKLVQGKMTMDELYEETIRTFDNLNIKFKDYLPGANGLYNPATWTIGKDNKLKLKPALIQIATETDKAKAGFAVSTLLHEVVHHIQAVVGLRKLGGQLGGDTSDIFITRGMERFLEPFNQGNFVGKAESLKAVRAELKQATEELLTLQFNKFNNLDLVAAREQAKSAITKGAIGDPDYYIHDYELVSRMAELMFVDPALARQVAPSSFEFVGRMIEAEAPNIRQLMSRDATVMLDLISDMWRIHGAPGEKDFARVIFEKGQLRFNEEQLLEFGTTGWAKGMRVINGGKQYEFLGDLGENVRIRSLDTGVVEVVPKLQLQRPTLQSVAKRDEEILRAIDNALDSRPTSLPVGIAETVIPEGGGMAANGIRRALVDIKEFLFIDGSVRNWIRELPGEVQEKLIAKYGQIRPIELRDLHRQGPAAETEKNILTEALALMGHKGLVRNDNGYISVFLPDPQNQIVKGSVVETQRFGASISGFALDNVLHVDAEDWLKHQLRSKGVSEADLDYFMEIAKRRLGERLKNLMDPEVRQVDENVSVVMGQVTNRNRKRKTADADQLDIFEDEDFARAGVETELLPDGQIMLRDAATKSVMGTMRTGEEGLAFVREMGVDNTGPGLGDFPGGSSHGGGGAPPKVNSQMIPPNGAVPPRGVKSSGSVDLGQKWSDLVDAQTLFGSIFTALENFARAAERKGLGPAYTKIYLPTHEAMLKVHRELSDVVRASLGGLTFKDKLQQISDALVTVGRKRYAYITGHIEALSKQEIEKAGGLMTRAMTQNEIRVAKYAESSGLQHDIPRLMSVDRLVDSALRGASSLRNTVARMEKIKLSPEAQQLLGMFKTMPRFKDREQVFNYLGLTKEERQLIKVIKDSRAADKDKFSIYAVSRYASAPSLKKGFKSGREQYAFENKLTEKELKISRLVEETLEAAFDDSGLDVKRHLSGYWPHLRVWVQQGFVPDKSLLPPDVLNWMASRYRSGELNVYDVDPLSVVYRHLRGLYMKRHFDPVMPGVNDTLASMRDTDPRAYNVMQEYVMELMGKPHASFEKLQGAVSRSIEVLTGKKINDRFVNDIVSSLSALTSAAVIPFRPALILRNFFESALKVSPRTGVGAYMKGLRYVVDGSTRKEAFQAALNAGAIRPGTQKLRSLHQAEELFGPSAPSFVHKYLQVFDKGFEWYQSADDWGRAIAFHAQRFRIMEHLGDFELGRITLEEFKSRAKINTFDPLDIEIAEQAFLNSNPDKAINHLGRALSKEAMTRYGYADHPAGWHSVQGRLFGQFGTWPVQYKDYLLQGVTRGSTKDKIEFAAIHAGVSGAIIAGGASVGLNLSNWTGSVFYTGGPMADLSIDVARSLTGSDAEKRLARYNLYAQIPVLGWMETGNPRSMFLPGSYLLGDLDAARKAMQDGDIFESVMSGVGLRVLRPQDRSPLQELFDFND